MSAGPLPAVELVENLHELYTLVLRMKTVRAKRNRYCKYVPQREYTVARDPTTCDGYEYIFSRSILAELVRDPCAASFALDPNHKHSSMMRKLSVTDQQAPIRYI